MKKVSQLSDSQRLQLQHNTAMGQKGKDNQFSDLLKEGIRREESVQFSKHAESRIKQRDIQMSDDLIANLNQAVQKAREKGAKDTVIIGAQGAFIVNVTNNIVITTMTEQEMKNNIFTNIDSAVLM